MKKRKEQEGMSAEGIFIECKSEWQVWKYVEMVDLKEMNTDQTIMNGQVKRLAKTVKFVIKWKC